jgi:hypothetical protein
MADPNTTPDAESKKDTVRINLPPSMTPPSAKPKTEEQAKHDTSAMAIDDQAKRATAPVGVDQTKKETAMMGMPSEAKKETSRVAVPTAKTAMSDMPRPTVRLRREPIPATPATAAATTTAARAQVPEMPRPTVKLKVEEALPAETPAPTPSAAPVPAPVVMEARSSWVDIVLSLFATASSVAVLVYLVLAIK